MAPSTELVAALHGDMAVPPGAASCCAGVPQSPQDMGSDAARGTVPCRWRTATTRELPRPQWCQHPKAQQRGGSPHLS